MLYASVKSLKRPADLKATLAVVHASTTKAKFASFVSRTRANAIANGATISSNVATLNFTKPTGSWKIERTVKSTIRRWRNVDGHPARAEEQPLPIAFSSARCAPFGSSNCNEAKHVASRSVIQ